MRIPGYLIVAALAGVSVPQTIIHIVRTGTLEETLTVQEALYSGGTAGVARTDEPVTVGIPLPDSATDGATSVANLTLTGTSVGQFRALGHWPSGRIKWVLVDTLASLSAGATDTDIAIKNSGGTGNFGGSDLAIDNGSTITVATGACTFTIREANFNGFHEVVCGSTTVVAAGASTGLVILGPAFNATTCGTCTTVYSSVNDEDSTCSIEENGPVRAVLKCTGGYNDASDNEYMKFTVRMHFYKGKSYVRAQTTLRNADNGASSSFATAYKGLGANEWRLTPTLTGNATYRVGTDAAEQTGTLTAGTGDIELYSGKSTFMEHNDWTGGYDINAYFSDTGWRVTKDASNLDTGTAAEPFAGYADIRGATDGAGVSIGVYQMAAYYPKSLEFNDAGSDVRIGIWPRQNTDPFYQAWPQWNTHDLYFNFHASALSSPSDEFLKFQHPLVARAPREHYNTTLALPYPIVDPVVEDAFFDATYAARNPATGLAFADIVNASPGGANPSGGNDLKLAAMRGFDWNSGGASRQMEFRFSWLMTWIGRGFTGHYLAAKQFYQFQNDNTAPHSDGFDWRDQVIGSTIDATGRPAHTSTNASLSERFWFNADHAQWRGVFYYYLMSGDELAKEAGLDTFLDFYANPDTNSAGATYGGEDGPGNARQTALALRNQVWLHEFLVSIGESSLAATVLENATNLFEADVKTALCTNAEQASQSCTASDWPDTLTDEGISRTRGMVTSGGGSSTWCVDEDSDGLRISSMWSGNGFASQALLELAKAKGSGWADYHLARDLAVGLYQGALDEAWVAVGNGRWDEDHWRQAIALDRVNACQSPPPTVDDYWVTTISILSHWGLFTSQYEILGNQDWVPILRQNLLKALNYNNPTAADFYSAELGAAIHYAMTTPATTLEDVTITGVTNNGGGSYTIQWTVPAGAQSYRIKYGAKDIVNWIGFAPATNTFVGNPSTTMNWFAATSATPPAPAGVGTTQSTTISTGMGTGLDADNFSVKAYVQ
jgi:hypothetical protein